MGFGLRDRLSVNASSVPAQRAKGSHHFFITLDAFEYYEEIRIDFISIFSSVVSYCCSIEKSSAHSRVSYHLHAYIEFSESLLLSELQEFIRCCFPNCRLDLKSCRRPADVLKYVSKEDWYLYTNVKKSRLHFNYQLHDWVVNTPRYSIDDPFVVSNCHRYRFLQQYHAEHLMRLYPSFRPFQPIEVVKCSWALSVSLWWNEIILGFKHKRKCLFLYGPSNVGKSSFVEHMIGRHNLRYVFYPGVGNFFMSDFRIDFHKAIIFEEFDSQHYPHSHLKRLLEGSTYSYSVKCQPDKTFKFHGPIIFISNYAPSLDSALENRLLVISAYDPYWSGVEELLVKTCPLSEVDGVSSEYAEIFLSDEEFPPSPSDFSSPPSQASNVDSISQENIFPSNVVTVSALVHQAPCSGSRRPPR